MSIYKNTLKTLLVEHVLDHNDKILVLAGGTQDRDVFMESDFPNVVISNVDHHAGVADYAP